jgi:primase-polymerase (primpol)-like protein
MSALDSLFNITNNEKLFNTSFKYCLVDESKHPFTIDEKIARPNHAEDFVNIVDLLNVNVKVLDKYKGLGVSIQASGVCAIDIDHCVNKQFDVNGISPLAKQIISLFEKFAYVEFSFSGSGIRIFFQADKIDDYESYYYTKNSKIGVEYYYPEGSARYVTITGRTIINNNPTNDKSIGNQQLHLFLELYMKRRYVLSKQQTTIADNRSMDDLMKVVKLKYLTDHNFQDLWFTQAPGSGHDESERDYHLVAYLYENITQDKNKLKEIFEQSPFFKSKDWKHMNKWNKQDFRYFNYVFERVQQKHRS